MSPISKNDLDQISLTIASAMATGFQQLTAALSQQQVAAPRAATATVRHYRFLAKGQKAAPSDLASKDAQIVAQFARRGFSVTLKDRANPDKPYDVRPFKGWLDQSRIVRKGQRSVKGLFHVTQTDALPPAKPTKGKAKPTLVKA